MATSIAPLQTHTIFDWLPIIISGASVVATIILGVVVVILNSKNAHRLEQLKASIGMELTEHSVRYSELHKKRAEVIEELYKLLVLTEIGVNRIVHKELNASESCDENKILDFWLSTNQVIEYYETKKIYLDLSLCEKIDRFIRELSNGAFFCGLALGMGDIDKKNHDDVLKDFERILDIIHMIKENIEAEFRGILGVSSEPI